MDLKAFMTGSHVYGTPHADSDVDLVVFLSETDVNHLRQLADPVQEERHHDENYMAAGGEPLRFGKLNLLCVTDERRYEIWLEGTQRLTKKAPVARRYAIRFFRWLRRKAGFHIPHDPKWDDPKPKE